MSSSTNGSQWSAKAEPLSPFSYDDNYWLHDDDLALNNQDIYASLPLSLIQQDKNLRSQFQEELFSFAQSASQSPTFNYSAASLYDGAEEFLGVKREEQDEDISPPESPPDSWGQAPAKPTRAQLASRLLNELDQCKQEPFSEWLEEKVDLPIFEDFSAPHDTLQTQTLLQEFENVCGAVGINHQHQHLTHLTPPQSPPFHQPQYTFQPSHAVYPTHVPQPSPIHNWQPDILDLGPQTQTELARELAVVEELVLRRAQDVNCNHQDIKPIPSPVSNESDNSVSDYYHPLQQYSKEDENSTQVAVTPPEHAYAKSTVDDNLLSGPFSPNSSSSCSLSGSSENEDEWGPSSSSSGASVSGRQKSYSRSKPYSRNPDDKRSRKKEQNKNAATRYRQKKKQEVEVLAGEEKELRDVHDELQGKCSDLQREVKYLKGLMRDLCRAKGLIK